MKTVKWLHDGVLLACGQKETASQSFLLTSLWPIDERENAFHASSGQMYGVRFIFFHTQIFHMNTLDCDEYLHNKAKNFFFDALVSLLVSIHVAV